MRMASRRSSARPARRASASTSLPKSRRRPRSRAAATEAHITRSVCAAPAHLILLRVTLVLSSLHVMKSPDSVLEHEGQEEEKPQKAEPLRRVKARRRVEIPPRPRGRDLTPASLHGFMRSPALIKPTKKKVCVAGDLRRVNMLREDALSRESAVCEKAVAGGER